MIIKPDLIAEWLSGLPKKEGLRIGTILAYLAGQRSWRNIPYIKKLTDCDDIYELIITCDNIQYRPLGCYGPGENEFTLLVGATKKGRIWDPKDAKNTAMKMVKLIRQRKAKKRKKGKRKETHK
ncbi:MAG: type II toxin-antitoxin system RelE/ParE family toxin [Desulfobaccales bacterium]